jgi:hypothetical protein
MALDATARRRWFGGAMLLAAVIVLIGGETLVKERLGLMASLICWLVCLVFTGLAILAAFLDVRALRRRTLQEQRDLFEATLKKIESEVETRPGQPDRTRRRAG